MNENIDLTKILKNCPKGTKFYSYIFGEETYFQGLSLYQGSPLPIYICGKYGEYHNFHLSRRGHPFSDNYGECCIFPSKEMRDWSKFTAPWLKSERFDPKTLKAFDKVLIKNACGLWYCKIFSHYGEKDLAPYHCILGNTNFCIPYNDETKHLVGTKDEAPEFYKYWED